MEQSDSGVEREATSSPAPGAERVRWLQTYLIVFGFGAVLVIPTVPFRFGSALLWEPRNVPTEVMIAAIYFAMGLVMLAASRTPLDHQRFVDFLIIANLLHGAIMFATAETGLHVVFDAVPITAMGLVPLLVYPWRYRSFLAPRRPSKSRSRFSRMQRQASAPPFSSNVFGTGRPPTLWT